MSRFWDKLSKEHADQLADGYDNFRQSVAMRYFTSGQYEKIGALTSMYDFIRSRGIMVDISDSLLGNPFYIKKGDQILTQDLLNSIVEVWTIGEKVIWPRVETVTEIGAGYGRFAHALLSKYPDISYTIIDIEPALSLAKWFLSQTHPTADITYKHPEEVQAIKADVVVCISLFDELLPEEIEHYFKLINDGARYFYYKAQRNWYNSEDGVKIGTAYPVREHWQELFRKGSILKDISMQGEFIEAMYRVCPA